MRYKYIYIIVNYYDIKCSFGSSASGIFIPGIYDNYNAMIKDFNGLISLNAHKDQYYKYFRKRVYYNNINEIDDKVYGDSLLKNKLYFFKENPAAVKWDILKVSCYCKHAKIM